MVGSRDDHRVHIRARQDLAVIASGEQIRAPKLTGAREPAVIDVADRYEFYARKRSRIFGVAAAHAADADGGDLNV